MTHFVLIRNFLKSSLRTCAFSRNIWRFHEIFGDFCLPFFQAAPARLYFPGQPHLADSAILVIGSLKIRPRCTGFTSPKSNSPPSPHLNFVGDVGRGPLHAAISATSLRPSTRTAIHFLAARSLRRQLSAIRDQFFVSQTENFVKTSSKRRHFTPVASIERAPDRVDRRASS